MASDLDDRIEVRKWLLQYEALAISLRQLYTQWSSSEKNYIRASVPRTHVSQVRTR